MARRKRASTLDDMTAVIALFPWWVGVVLAVAGYAFLHRVANQPVVLPVNPAQMHDMIFSSVFRGLATGGQYLLPIVCLLGALGSAWGRHERRRLVANVTHSEAGDALNGMSWQQFELLVGEGFRMQGYQVAETGGGGADGGVDLVLRRPGRNGSEKFLVQCKQWRAYKVGVDVVRELYGVMAAHGAAGGFVVTSGRFTEEAVRFAEGRNVTLVDGPKLHGLLKQARRAAEQQKSSTSSTPTRPVAAAPSHSAEKLPARH